MRVIMATHELILVLLSKYEFFSNKIHMHNYLERIYIAQNAQWLLKYDVYV